MNISFLKEKGLKEKGNKYLIFILLGVLLLVLSIPTGTSKQVKGQESSSLQDGGLEARLETVLAAMEGVGRVEVMITTEAIDDALFSTGEGRQKVSGVVVVAEGAGTASVDARIMETVKALFSIDAHKISIVKMRLQEGDK